jgi:broad specificity phosphatase PhoE
MRLAGIAARYKHRMATLHFIRHGQASFGAANYDQLSDLGALQAQALGVYLRTNDQTCVRAHTGTLARHRQTWDSLRTAFEAHRIEKYEENRQFAGIQSQSVAINNIVKALPTPSAQAALNEYDSEALIHAALHAAGKTTADLPSPRTPEGYKLHFRVLREALLHWIEGRITPQGMPSFADFRGGLAALLDDVRAAHGQDRDAQIWVVSSGGPISTVVMHVLGAPPQTMIDLNYQMRNAAVTSFQVSQKKIVLSSFNNTAHLGAGHITST